MCCEAFCRGLCSILSSSAILVLDIVDVAVGAALLFSPLLWSSYVTAAPATIALPSYGACLVILSAVSLFGVGFRSNSGLLAAAVLAALCFVTEFTGGLIVASDPDFAAKLGLEIPTGWALLVAVASLRHAVRGASNGALGRARDAFDALRARRRAEEQAAPSQLSERLLERRADRAAMRAELTAKYFSEESPKPEPRKWWSLRKSEPEEEAAAELPSCILRSKNYAAPRSFDDDEENGFAI